jgi:hypothetical protein
MADCMTRARWFLRWDGWGCLKSAPRTAERRGGGGRGECESKMIKCRWLCNRYLLPVSESPPIRCHRVRWSKRQWLWPSSHVESWRGGRGGESPYVIKVTRQSVLPWKSNKHYIVWVSVALLIQHTKRMRRVISSSVACLAPLVFLCIMSYTARFSEIRYWT